MTTCTRPWTTDRWPARMPTPLIGPLPAEELSVPAEQGLRPDEREPPVPGHRHAAVANRLRSRPWSRGLHLPLQHCQLVPEHQELDLPPFIRTSSVPRTRHEVHEREEHGTPFHDGRACYCRRRTRSGNLNPSPNGRTTHKPVELIDMLSIDPDRRRQVVRLLA
jgi:hypothetical protein